MVKCVVSGCPNRVGSADANRPPKRFFRFPREPERAKVWLAALRETDMQDSTEQHFICQDHFLPEDVSVDGVNSDAIPIMPPCLDGPLGSMSAWRAESSEEEDQWAGGGEEEEEEDGDDDDDAAYEGGDEPPPAPEPPPAEPPAVDPPQQDPQTKKTSETRTPDVSLHQKREKPAVSLTRAVLLQGFLKLLAAAPDGLVDCRQAAKLLQTRRQRITEITKVLQEISLLERHSHCMFKWIGQCQISSFLTENQPKLRELNYLRLVEDSLDGVIRSCAQQFFNVTDDAENAALAYVTYEDISRLRNLQEQTVFVVKAPDESTLVVPAPTEDSIQVRLKGVKGPIMVLTCDIGAEEQSGSFTALEESRITTTALHTGSSSPQTS